MCKAWESEDDGSDGSLRLLQVAMVILHGLFFPKGMGRSPMGFRMFFRYAKKSHALWNDHAHLSRFDRFSMSMGQN